MKNVLTIIICSILFAGVTEILPQVGAQVPIAPNSIPQFVDPVPHFAGIRVDATGGGDLYVNAVPSDQIALSTGTVVNGGIIGGVIDPIINPSLGKAHVWAYEISTDDINYTPPLWPGFTVVTQRGYPLNVTYNNNLQNETYDKVGLIVDQTLHWANPSELLMNDPQRFNPYAGEPLIVPHLHGGEVRSDNDGGPDAWFNHDFSKTGPSWGIDGTDNLYYYPNSQETATLWFHDHLLGGTRLNVYAGMAAFYFLKDGVEDALQLPGWSGDGMVQEVAPLGTSGTFNPNPYLPEIELALQDRMFDMDGKLYFVNNMPPNPTMHPFWNPEFIGDVMTVNGKTWPYLSVAPRKYRFRILNGSNSRFYELWLQDLATGTFGPAFQQIGTDGGLLDAPVIIDPALGGKLIIGPGERVDVIIDFTNSPAGAIWTMRNSGRAPYPFGGPPQGKTMGRIMQFVVNGQLVGADNSQVPAALRTTPLVKLTDFAGIINGTPTLTRQLTLNEVMGAGGPLEALVNNTKWDGNGMMEGLAITEMPTEGTTEVWQIINMTGDAHPIHLHLVQFQLVSRQKFNTNKYGKAYNALFTGSFGTDPITGIPYVDPMTGNPPLDHMTGLPYPPGVFMGGYGPPASYNTNNADGAIGGNPGVTPYLQGPKKPANLNERGWKDTFIMYPGEVTTVVVRFAPTDMDINTLPANQLFGFDPSKGPGYVWHCHIIDHEDNEMMRPYTVNPNPSRTTLPKTGTLADALPSKFELEQNYPNPFNPNTVINFSVPNENTLVTLKVYNSLGEEVGTLINQVVPAGQHQVNFDATGLSSGVYFYTIAAGNFVDSKKMVVMK